MGVSGSALERQVAQMGVRPAPGNVEAARWEARFAVLLELLAPRIGHLIRTYGLADWREDAEQVCAIGVFRALESYDPGKAHFTTHVTWQLRGELQSLRHRVRLDQRQSARSASARTVSLEGLGAAAGQDNAIFEIVDEGSLTRTESGASDHLAGSMLAKLLERLDAPTEERRIVLQSIFGENSDMAPDRTMRERHRQIMRRTFRNCAKLLAA